MISVIVPARDAATTLGACLDALAAQDLGEPFEVIVADDASADGSAALARAHPVVTEVVASARAGGPGAARSAAVARSTGAVLAFTDADCVPAPGWLRAGQAALDAGAGLVQGRVEPLGDAGPFDRTVRIGQPTWLFETANLFISRERFDAAGGFEPWLAPRDGKELGEDVWLGWRAVRGGAAPVFAHEALVRHAVFPRSAAGFVLEMRRTRHFPEMTRRIPELREHFLYHRWFLTERSMLFDGAVAAVVLAAAARRPLLLAGAVPYVRLATRAARPHGRRRAPVVAAVRLAADAVTLGALLAGSVEGRTVVL